MIKRTNHKDKDSYVLARQADKIKIDSQKYPDTTLEDNINDLLFDQKLESAMCSHAFHKGFKSICEQSGVKSINVELLLGHYIGVSGHYYRPVNLMFWRITYLMPLML